MPNLEKISNQLDSIQNLLIDILAAVKVKKKRGAKAKRGIKGDKK